MTSVLCCGGECGDGVSIGAHWAFSGTGTVEFSTTVVKSGARAVRVANVAQTGAAQLISIAGSSFWVCRFYLYVQVAPANQAQYIDFGNNSTAPTIQAGLGYKPSDGKWYLSTFDNTALTNTFSSAGITIPLNMWVQVDLKVDMSANPWLIDGQINDIAFPQLTVAKAAALTTGHSLRIRRDNPAASDTFDLVVDDVIISHTIGDYPISPGGILAFVPASDGTHNIAGTGDFERTLTGVDILNSTTDAFLLVDDIPLDSGAGTDWINMVAPPSAANYVECIFGPAPNVPIPTIAPITVEVIAAIRQASAANGNMEIKLNDNGTEDAVYSATGVAGVTTIRDKRKHYATPPTGGAWTVVAGNGNFNGLRVRFGSPAALDVNPDQYFAGIMIEAEFAEVIVPYQPWLQRAPVLAQ